MTRMTREDRFWSKVDKTGTCWLWTASRFWDGYGQFRTNVSHQRAHRVAFELTYGLIPAGLCVLHSCDVPACVNPAHLSLGTQRDNARDRDRKGRGNACRGAQHWGAKLDVQQVRTIRRLAAYYTQRVLALRFGVSQTQISRIVNGECWDGRA